MDEKATWAPGEGEVNLSLLTPVDGAQGEGRAPEAPHCVRVT